LFISQDPIGFLNQFNFYLYAVNVWNWIDPFGLDCKKQIEKRRAQLENDISFKTEKAARREAIRRFGGVVKESNNYKKKLWFVKNKNIRGPQNEPAEIIIIKNTKGETVEIMHHKWGHQFEDNQTFEYPHFHGPNGDHISYSQNI